MTLASQVIIVVPGSTVDYNQTFISDSWDAELTLTYQAYPDVSSDPLDTQLTDIPAGAIWLRAHIEQLDALPPVTDVEFLHKRLMPSVSLDVLTPVIVRGRPMTPKYWAQSSITVNLDTNPGHLGAEDNPDPIWDSVHHTWTVAPPLGGVGQGRWTIDTLPDPASVGGSYPLGAATSKDGSNALPSGCLKWAPDLSTASAPNWNSAYPFKPTVSTYTHHNSDGSTFTVPKAVHVNTHYAQHMWLDFGDSEAMPFSWIMIAIILDFPGGIYRHFLLDSGKTPFSYVKSPTPATASVNTDFPGTDEGLNYRNYLAVDKHYQYLTNLSGHYIHTKHPMNPRPRMYFGIWNGTSSYVGNWSHGVKNTFKGKLTAESRAHRYYTMGRSNGHLGAKWGAHMVVFEMRYWDSALTTTELNAQYSQLASTWKFSQYK